MNLVIINGAIHTMDYRDTLAEAVAIQDGRIVAIGSNDEVKDFPQARGGRNRRQGQDGNARLHRAAQPPGRLRDLTVGS